MLGKVLQMLDLQSVGLFGQAFKFIDVWGKWLKESHRTQLFEVDKIVFIGYSIIILSFIKCMTQFLFPFLLFFPHFYSLSKCLFRHRPRLASKIYTSLTFASLSKYSKDSLRKVSLN